jgi:putative transcriptional regulator
MMPRFHVQQELLLDYASGSLPAPVSLLVATHLTLCPDCRGVTADFETVGGALLEDIDPIAMAADAMEAALDGLDDEMVEAGRDGGQSSPDPDAAPDPDAGPAPTPLVLSRLLGTTIDEIAWNRRARGVAEVELPCGDDRYSASLLRIDPDIAIPNHTHEGEELTLVLRGAFSDADGHYGRGDVCHATPEVAHAPVADPGEACVCLVVADGSVKLTGLVGRMLNPFLKL